MRAEIISIGAELASGQEVDTNAAWLSARLTLLGVSTGRHVTVGDDLKDIAAALREAAGRSALIVITGGLGPTLDDVTRDALAEATGRPLELDEASFRAIEAYFASIGRPMSPCNRRQAFAPRGAIVLANEWGTAPGIRIAVESAAAFVLPGVPREMKAMFERYVTPWVEQQPDRQAHALRILRTYGAGESALAEQIADLMSPGRNPSVGTTASEGIISVRIAAWAASQAEADRLVAGDAAAVRSRLGNLVYGEGGEDLAAVVGRMLAEQGRTVSTAESCTGGLVGKLLTDVSGSSVYYLGGFVAYSNRQKSAALNVPAETIEKHGAVSEPVAQAMAAGCRQATGSDYALAITGVAGPTGGTTDKPVGLVFIGVAGLDGVLVRRCQFSGRLDRAAIRDRSAKTALDMLRRRLADAR